MTAHDIDPNGYLDLLQAFASHIRSVFRSRAWRQSSGDACCA